MLCILIRIHKLISPENSPRNVAKTFTRERKNISDAEFLVFCLKFCEFNWILLIILEHRKNFRDFCPKITSIRATIFHCHSTIFPSIDLNLMMRVKFTTFASEFYATFRNWRRSSGIIIFYALYLQPHHKGLFLLELICEQLDVSEKDYFGIKYVDNLKQRVSGGQLTDVMCFECFIPPYTSPPINMKPHFLPFPFLTKRLHFVPDYRSIGLTYQRTLLSKWKVIKIGLGSFFFLVVVHWFVVSDANRESNSWIMLKDVSMVLGRY